MIAPDRSESLLLGRVLVVDDELELMTVLSEMLTDYGYEVLGCSSGQEALDALRDREFDVLLADLMMPGMTGIQLIKAAQEIDPNLVGIVMTGQGTVSTAVEAMQVGAFDYLLKPFKLDLLLPVLSRAMSVRRLRLENVRLHETVAIHELAKTVAFVLDANAILDKLADGALQQCQAEEASVMLPTRDGSELYVATVRGEGRSQILGQRVGLGQGIAGWVAQQHEPLTLRGAVDDPRFAPVAARTDLQWSMLMPMLLGGKLVGILNVSSKRSRPVTLGQVKGLSILTASAAGALEHARLYREARDAEERYRSLADRLRAVVAFARDVSGSLQLESLFDIAWRRISELTSATWVHVAEYEAAKNQFRIAAIWPHEGPGLLRAGSTIGSRQLGAGSAIGADDNSASGRVLRTGQPYVVQDLQQLAEPTERERSLADRGIGSRITVPIAIGGEFWGTVGLGFSATGAATSERVEFLEAMAAHLAVAIRNAQMYSQLQDANERIQALNDSLERRVEERTSELATANKVIAREQATLSATMASMSDGLIVMDRAGRISYCNAQASDLVGTPGERLAGKTLEEALLAIRESLAEPESASKWLDATKAPGHASAFDFTTRSAPGRDVSARAFAVAEPSGDPLGVGILLRDVSVEREMDRMRDELLSVVSHELRTPLASLVGFAELLLTRTYDERRRREFLNVIREEGHRLTALINDFLDLQRMESGRASVVPTATELRPLLERAVAAAPADAQSRISLDVPADLPLGRADADATHQVLMNLLSNAVKYSREGTAIRVTARFVDGTLLVSVIDDGLGIPPDALPRVFDKFYRVDNSDRRSIKGTGLGLAICRQIVAAHGGRIWAESDGLGRGAQFHFTLPVAEQWQATGDVLIVEDDPGFARLLAEELQRASLISSVAASGAAALSHIAMGMPQAIVLDLILPDISGEALLASVQEQLQDRIPIVVVTVKDLDQRERADLEQLGARVVLRKGPKAAAAAARAVAAALAVGAATIGT